MKARKINFYAEPGAGKSTVAALLYSELKVLGFSVELVREYAKELVYLGEDLSKNFLETQVDIFSNQIKRERILEKNVEWIISDSPLLLNSYYSREDFFKKLALESNNKEDLHFWIEKSPNEDYDPSGRSHSKKESKKISSEMKGYLAKAGINLIDVKGSSKEKASFVLSLILKLKKSK